MPLQTIGLGQAVNPEVVLRVDGRFLVAAVVDSGAVVSIMTEEVAKLLRAVILPDVLVQRLLDVQLRDILCAGVTRLTFEVEGRMYTHPFQVMVQPGRVTLLGWDFQETSGLMLLPLTWQFAFQDAPTVVFLLAGRNRL